MEQDDSISKIKDKKRHLGIKKVKSFSENLNEISKTTLKNYIRTARIDRVVNKLESDEAKDNHQKLDSINITNTKDHPEATKHLVGLRKHFSDKAKISDKKFKNRDKGIMTATKKLKESEQLELSDKYVAENKSDKSLASIMTKENFSIDDLSDEEVVALREHIEHKAFILEACDKIIDGAISDNVIQVQDAVTAILNDKVTRQLQDLQLSIAQDAFEIEDVSVDEQGRPKFDEEDSDIEDEEDFEIDFDDEEFEESNEEEIDESTELNEISKKTLGNYINKAHNERSHNWSSEATREKGKIDSLKKSKDHLDNLSFSSSGLSSKDREDAHNLRDSLRKNIEKLDNDHTRKNNNRRVGTKRAVNRLQGKFAPKTIHWEEPEKTPTGRDSKNKTVKKTGVIFKDYKGD